jgi:hypothetical protein
VSVILSKGKQLRKVIRKTVNNLLRTCNGLRLVSHDRIKFDFFLSLMNVQNCRGLDCISLFIRWT